MERVKRAEFLVLNKVCFSGKIIGPTGINFFTFILIISICMITVHDAMDETQP